MILRVLGSLFIFAIAWVAFWTLTPPIAMYLTFMSRNWGYLSFGGLTMNVLISREYTFYMGFFVAVVIALVLNLFAGSQSEENDTGSLGFFEMGDVSAFRQAASSLLARIPQGKSRPGIAAAIFIGLGLLLAVGLIWAAIYYGFLLPVQNTSTAIFGTSFYDVTTLQVMEITGAGLGLIITVAVVWWWWQKSQKPPGYGGL